MNFARAIVLTRYYSKVASSSTNSTIQFKKFKFTTKVPQKPVHSIYKITAEAHIDKDTIQLLERLSLVDLDSKDALKTLESSIQFANRITDIPTENIKPLYTILESHALHLRKDKVVKRNTREEFLANAKVIDEDYLVAPPGNVPLEMESKIFNL